MSVTIVARHSFQSQVSLTMRCAYMPALALLAFCRSTIGQSLHVFGAERQRAPCTVIFPLQRDLSRKFAASCSALDLTQIFGRQLLHSQSFKTHNIIGATRFVERLIHMNRMTAIQQGGNHGCCI